MGMWMRCCFSPSLENNQENATLKTTHVLALIPGRRNRNSTMALDVPGSRRVDEEGSYSVEGRSKGDA